ncbi:hypothetical protein Xcel_2694 [Xylanimonas cellulosilytica DSM 15894]|uniref:Rhamnosyl transferase n=1 Tax=Xylanimonas cellulosilytica (strain DSM 15894 / JCM 12276 / CECT 5975 / KCTC 9989 / LMG 20990 / NBRC 107835 / XIL07) TaxID=446471 RepID=D1BXR7_XYLCX|nr:glycosyltransferase [Xylanimonas cellulosilytica]ACZ31708.1 hypothetical protein Xcel_2694 [Xylanimonas cellulosilytica DSM 15894]
MTDSAVRHGEAPANDLKTAIDHVLVTRFNLPSPGPESLIRAQDGWLAERIELFETYTVPSVRHQTVRDFRWIVYLDPQSPAWLVERLAPLVDDGLITPIYTEHATWENVRDDARAVTGGAGSILITTNLDNDDALATDFVERLQQRATPGRREALYLGYGLIVHGDRVYLRRDPHNAFCSVAEPWDGALTAWRDWHIGLSDHMPAETLDGPPAWLQVVHGKNVSNRVRGRLVDPSRYRDSFAGLLDGVPRPSRRVLLRETALARPAREGRELVRSAGKAVVLRVVGKDGLQTLRGWLARRPSRR